MIIAVVLLVFFLYIGIKLQYTHYCKVYKSGFMEAEGSVVDYKKSIRPGNNLYSSIVEFTANGKSYRVVQKSAASWKQKLGKKVSIMYNPLDPTDSVFKNDNSGFLLVAFSLFLLFLVIGSRFF